MIQKKTTKKTNKYQYYSGEARATYNVGMMYLNEKAGDVNTPEAIKWLKKASQQGFQAADILLYIYIWGNPLYGKLKFRPDSLA